jgi:hypothetical protein
MQNVQNTVTPENANLLKFAPTDRLQSSSHKFFGVSKQKIIISQNQQKNCYRQKDLLTKREGGAACIFSNWKSPHWSTLAKNIIIF